MCGKIAAPRWPRDNYGYIAMSAPAEAAYGEWAQERQWVPWYYTGVDNNLPMQHRRAQHASGRYYTYLFSIHEIGPIRNKNILSIILSFNNS